MVKIQRLTEDTVNKIAAGEVVERPASVVKELVENSLDAGASQISIAISDGGKKSITVSDNGCGIPRDELALALERHTTSKIAAFDDIARLHTKGFRGEALASICSVAKVTVGSAVADGEGSEVIVEAGRFIDQRACAVAQGTVVNVKYLFYQTPARLKFLKTTETETDHIVAVVTKLALSHPPVGFKLTEHGESLLDVPRDQGFFARVRALLGNDIAAHLYEFNGDEGGMEANGFLSHPQIARSQRSLCYFFVNDRVVQDKVLWHATLEAYRDLLMRGKYPIVVLKLKLNENCVDVNVHPAKTEVRFQNSQLVHSFVHKTLRTRLQARPWAEQFVGAPFMAPVRTGSINRTPTGRFVGGQRMAPAHSEPRQDTSSSSHPPNLSLIGKTPYAQMQPIGQFLATYILCAADEKLILVDQHAAHERVGFEKLLVAYQNTGIKKIPLLIPETFDLKPSDAEILKNYLGELEGFGFEIEFFGGESFVIKAIPEYLKDKLDSRNLFANLLEDIKETGELISLKDKFHHVLATMACHAQIRAHHTLTLEEMRALLTELDLFHNTDFCPHGRPVFIEITQAEIEKWFKRVL